MQRVSVGVATGLSLFLSGCGGGSGGGAPAPISITIGRYPGYTGNLTVSGSVDVLVPGAPSGEISRQGISLQWTLKGLEALACSRRPTAANACGIQIHNGRTCSVASAIGGQFTGHNMTADDVHELVDPWAPVVYSTGTSGRATGNAVVDMYTGGPSDFLTFAEAGRRAVVVYDSTGAGVGCGLLPGPPVPPEPFTLAAIFCSGSCDDDALKHAYTRNISYGECVDLTLLPVQQPVLGNSSGNSMRWTNGRMDHYYAGDPPYLAVTRVNQTTYYSTNCTGDQVRQYTYPFSALGHVRRCTGSMCVESYWKTGLMHSVEVEMSV